MWVKDRMNHVPYLVGEMVPLEKDAIKIGRVLQMPCSPDMHDWLTGWTGLHDAWVGWSIAYHPVPTKALLARKTR